MNVLDVDWQFVEAHRSDGEGQLCHSAQTLTFALGAAGKSALLNGGIRVTVINPGDQNWETTALIHRSPALRKDLPALGFMAQLFVEYMMPGINPLVAASPALLQVQKKLNQKLVLDAVNAGATYVTLTVPGFSPLNPNQLRGSTNDLALWQTDPAAYWKIFDQALGLLEEQNLAYVIRDWNDISVFPTLAGDNQHEFITNPDSKSYQLYLLYWKQLITRYADRPGLLQIGMGGEWNLAADLDMEARCKTGGYGNLPGWCDVIRNYSSDEFFGFLNRTLSLFRGYGPNVKFASELGLSQGTAYHLQQNPEWTHSSQSFVSDTLAQGQANLTRLVSLFDIQGEHNYNGGDAFSRWGYLTNNPQDTYVLVNDIKPVINGPIYFGELGEAPRTDANGNVINAQEQKDRPYTLEMMALMKAWGGGTRATLWGWQFTTITGQPYQQDTLFFDFAAPYFSFLNQVQAFHRAVGQPTLSAISDAKTPLLVITWPIPGSPIVESSDPATDNNFVAISASANSSKLHALSKIVVEIDGVVLGVATDYPYRVRLPNGFGSSAGPHEIQVMGFDTDGGIGLDHVTWK